MAFALNERISLLVSDVDGTLVTDDKGITDSVARAAAALEEAGVKVSLVSSRPPMGFAALASRLALKWPLGAFNGGAIIDRDLSIIRSTLVPAADARIAIETFVEFGIGGWLFSLSEWYVIDPSGDLVPKERRTIDHEPRVVASFDDLYGQVGKLVGASRDHDRVAACEAALADRLSGDTVAKRSQAYYLDVTPARSDKGQAVRDIASVLNVPMDQVAVIGDMANDMPMFDVAPFRIAMGNGIEALKRRATFVTQSNQHDGWALAADRYILPRAGARRSA